MTEILTCVVLALTAVFVLSATVIVWVLYGDLVRRGMLPPLVILPDRKSREHKSRAQSAQEAIDRRGGVNA